MKIAFTLISHNKKTGGIPVSTSSAETCPPSCPFKGQGCYAASGPLALWWKKVSEGTYGLEWDAFLKSVKSLARGTLWRHNQAGDLAGKGEKVDAKLLAQLVEANRGRRGFTYTHCYNDSANHAAIKHANQNGFTVNLSANNLAHADTLADLNIGPVCAIVPSTVDGNQIRTMSTPAGRKGVVCPATYREASTCANCGLCQRADRSVIVLFPAHGTSFKRVDAIAARVHDHSTPTLAASAAA